MNKELIAVETKLNSLFAGKDPKKDFGFRLANKTGEKTYIKVIPQSGTITNNLSRGAYINFPVKEDNDAVKAILAQLGIDSDAKARAYRGGVQAIYEYIIDKLPEDSFLKAVDSAIDEIAKDFRGEHMKLHLEYKEMVQDYEIGSLSFSPISLSFTLWFDITIDISPEADEMMKQLAEQHAQNKQRPTLAQTLVEMPNPVTGQPQLVPKVAVNPFFMQQYYNPAYGAFGMPRKASATVAGADPRNNQGDNLTF